MKSSFKVDGHTGSSLGKMHNCSHNICKQIGPLFRNEFSNKPQYTDNFLNSSFSYKRETLLKNQSAESSRCQTNAKHNSCKLVTS